jgi:hypothetical protein
MIQILYSKGEIGPVDDPKVNSTFMTRAIESWKGYRETTSLSNAPTFSDRNSQVSIRLYQGR